MIAARPDLLVIGGLTIDRFADGSSAPGGSVLHIARAAAARGIRVALMTVAGPEPEAQAALSELRELAAAFESADADATATFIHNDTGQGRQLGLERLGGRIEIARSALLTTSDVVLVAPVAGEVPTDGLTTLEAVPRRAAILQGWLRSLDQGAEVRPLPIQSLGSTAIAALGSFDLLLASREDLMAESGDPREQLRSLRHAVGAGPALVVTAGTDGIWIDAEASTRHIPVPRPVSTISTVGAGDILAAFLVTNDRAASLEHRAGEAMRVVADVLVERGI